ncbi:hypothetical protein [Pseudomonas fluorescens]|uniref:hypothetical protein n=1 Tax=Pseudomonas fluorescens TaxID=294 RepID=UPI000A9FF8AC|nr:hypothetical protein [Pseudomonas fluorescens]
MSVNIDSQAQPLDIAPVLIPGWVTAIQHPDDPHGGVPLSLAVNDKIQLLVDPWRNQSPFDAAGILLEDSQVPVITETIKPGEENKRFTMELPDGVLRNGINRIRLQVTRVTQAPVESPTLKVLYNRPRPAGEIAQSGDNPNLVMTLPDDVLKGIDAARAAAGVDVTLGYIHMRERDVITLDCDSQTKSHTVTAAQAAAGAVVMKLFTNDFWQDNPRFALRFKAIDQLGNSSGPQAIWSAATLVDVHIRKQPELDLQAPKVLEAKELNGRQLNFVRDFYEAAFATVEVSYTGSDTGQTVQVQWLGRNYTYRTAVQTVARPGQILRFQIPRLEVIDNAGAGHAEVTYTVRRPGTTVEIPSRDLDLTVTGQKYLLGEPSLNSDNTNLRAYYPALIDGSYTVRMALHGVVVRYGEEVLIKDPDYTNLPIPAAWILENRGREVIFNYTLNRTGASEPLVFSWCRRVRL